MDDRADSCPRCHAPIVAMRGLADGECGACGASIHDPPYPPMSALPPDQSRTIRRPAAEDGSGPGAPRTLERPVSTPDR
ncbi:MAG: hypothetical protein HY815_01235 [Candidatus Riflebacteria bacterium]|nr:hypothetical protein [Candidatus Riflebacteria bacterium]